MATITINSAPTARQASRRRTMLGRLVDAIVESRMREAERTVSSHLLGFDDAVLEAHGLDRAALRRKASGAYL